MKIRFLCILILFSCACVSIETEKLERGKRVAVPYAGLEMGEQTTETIHFFVHAYSQETADNYARLCELYYSNIMNDTNLYSFVPARPYEVFIYKDVDEYVSKTKSPRWSGGITYGNAILTYESEGAKPILSHEITHLVFNEFMGLSRLEELRWLNEGLAVYEETRASLASKKYFEEKFQQVTAVNPIPLSQMINIVPLDENGPLVDKWYSQVFSVVKFMIEDGGSFPFSIFLKHLREGVSIEDALRESFHGKWHNLKELEKSWRSKIGI